MGYVFAFLAGMATVVLILTAEDWRLKRKAKAETKKHFERR